MNTRRFQIFSWGVLFYNIIVILWGAFVRASHSGDGCGAHWPLCHGQVIPQAQKVATLIEFGHRLTSGLALLLVVGMLIWAYRIFPRGHLARVGALLSFVFMVTEALVGAGLVLFELVGGNDSAARAAVMALHLINTFLLLGALTLTSWWAAGGGPLRLRGQGIVAGLLGGALLGMMLLGSSGALTALADTLFPVASLAQGLAQKLDPDAHYLVQLRILHPLIAGMLGMYLFSAVGLVCRMRPSPATTRYAQLLIALFIVQGAAGALNVVLLTPVLIQIIHLLLADLVWIALVLLSAEALSLRYGQQRVTSAYPSSLKIADSR